MDLSLLKKIAAEKRKAVEDIAIDNDGKKFVRRADLYKKEMEAYFAKNEQSQQSHDKVNGTKVDVDEQLAHANADLPRNEVIKRLRTRGAPILLFGESERDATLRLRKLEIEQPELNEGWKNEFQSALNKVEEEFIEEVVKGKHNDEGRHDVAMPVAAVSTWEQIEGRAHLLGQDENPDRDCDIIHEFLIYLLKRWGRQLNERDEAVKRSPQGKLEAGTHKQTMENIKPLLRLLEKHTCALDIRTHLIHIARLCILDRDYIRANNAYMELAIGNAPWPVGVTRSGIHQRPGSAKAYVSNIAHVLNEENQRKYIHALKRLMTKCQEFFASDPSKCVEYVRKNEDSSSSV